MTLVATTHIETTTRRVPSTSLDAAAMSASIGDGARFESVFARHHDVVFRYVASRLGPVAAEDVVSEVFADAFRARAKFDPNMCDSALPWLLGFATRRIAKQRTGEAQWLRATSVHDLADDSGSEDERVARVDASRLTGELRIALVRLRAAEREPLLLHVLGELSYDEVAVALGIPVGTVRSRISRARTRLAGYLDGAPR